MRRPTVLAAVALLAILLAPLSRAVGQAEPSFVGGLHLGGPVGASLAAGASVKVAPGAEFVRDLFVVVEPGLKGDRISVGYATIGQLGTILSARASYLRMRREPAPTPYAGIELQFAPLALVGTRVSVFAPLERDRGQQTTVFANFSIGL